MPLPGGLLEAQHPPIGGRQIGLERSHERWVINKVRALGSWYTKGLDNGSQLRAVINSAESLDQLRDAICRFFFVPAHA